jgi:hypothetical protein
MQLLPIVIVIAPQGAGKNRHAEALMQRFGCTHIVDEWDGVAELAPGALALCNLSLDEVVA